MRAAVLRACGRPPELAERDAPTPGAGELAVAVTAAPITPLDLLCATGTSYLGRPETPYVPGVQGVGTVDGAAVWFPTAAGMAPGDGSMREVATVRREDLVPLPRGADPVQVAGLGLSAVAAWMALSWRGGLAGGETVVVLGAGGVVGQAGVQLARLAGAGRVVAAARSAAARDRATGYGADAVVALAPDDDPAGLAERLRAACDGGADLVLDPLFGTPAAAALRVLRPHGRLVNLGGSAGPSATLDSATLRSRSLRVLGYTNNELTAAQRRAAMELIAGHVAAGRLRARVEPAPLSRVAEVWTRTEGGRVVLVPEEGL
jgi:NADPH:quinone reductase